MDLQACFRLYPEKGLGDDVRTPEALCEPRLRPWALGPIIPHRVPAFPMEKTGLDCTRAVVLLTGTLARSCTGATTQPSLTAYCAPCRLDKQHACFSPPPLCKAGTTKPLSYMKKQQLCEVRG